MLYESYYHVLQSKTGEASQRVLAELGPHGGGDQQWPVRATCAPHHRRTDADLHVRVRRHVKRSRQVRLGPREEKRASSRL